MTGSGEFQQRVLALHRALGIPADYMETCRLPLCVEPEQLVDTEPDFYQRPQRLTPAAFAAWRAMKVKAADSGVSIFLISAFRSIQYQHDVIAAKLRSGRTIEDILAVNAAPGFSEHHSGRAVDIGTHGCDALVRAFENTDAFRWLNEQAAGFGFHMTYTPDNDFGIEYEPWHWCFRKNSTAF